MASGISSSDAGLISSRLEENFLQIKEEGNHARWRGRTSNPVGDGSRSWVGSTPTAFRQFCTFLLPFFVFWGMVICFGAELKISLSPFYDG